MFGRTGKKCLDDNQCGTDFTECSVCGQNHGTDECPFLSCQYTVADAAAPSHARLTLPRNLEVQDLADGTTTVIARAKFIKGTRFGPFQAALTSILPPEVNFPLKVFGSAEEDSFYLDTRNEDQCNWMCLVAPVSSSNDNQNLICYQVRHEVFYSVLHDIEAGEELRVWYAPYYAIKMGVSPGKVPCPSATLTQEIEMAGLPEVTGEIVAWEADTTTSEVPPSASAPVDTSDHGLCRKVGKLVEEKDFELKKGMLEKAAAAFVAQQLPPSRLGARFAPPCWRCRECGAKEVSVIEYARHLMQHLKPPPSSTKKLPCSLCRKKFSSQELLNAHEECRHGIPDVRLSPTFGMQDGNKSRCDISPMPQESPESCHNFTLEPLNCSLNNDAVSLQGENGLKPKNLFSSFCSTLEITRSVDSSGDDSSTPQDKICSLDSVSLQSNLMSNNCSALVNGDSECNAEERPGDCRTLVAVMGSSGLNYLMIPLEHGKDVNDLLQSIQEPSLERLVACPAGVPETILNHEFFTRVAGETVVRDVKSLLSKGYSLQFLVEDEDGSSSLVDVLSTPSGAADNVTSSTDAYLREKGCPQQLVIMANGNVPESLPLALQNILPPAVPIAPSVPESTSESEIKFISQTSVVDEPNKHLSANRSSSIPSNDHVLSKQDSISGITSHLNTLLPSSIVSDMCYDSNVYTHSNSVDAIMEMNVNDKVLEKELDHELRILHVPLTADDTSSTDYILNSGSEQSPKTTESDDLHTPMKLLDQCLKESLPSHVTFNFDGKSSADSLNNLRNSFAEEKNNECGNVLSTDFHDLIAADAENSNVVLNIQPADSTGEIHKTLSHEVLGFIDKDAKRDGDAAWMEGEGFSLQSVSSNSVIKRDILGGNEHSSVDVSFQASSLEDYCKLSQGFKEKETEDLSTFNTSDFHGLLYETHSGNVSSQETDIHHISQDETEANADSHNIAEEGEPEKSSISSGPPFTCDICNKSFGRSAYLYRHLRKHTGEFTCVACRAVFARKETLLSHECAAQPIVSSINRQRLSCPFCPKHFAVKKQLTRHITNHTGNPLSVSKPIAQRPNEAKAGRECSGLREELAHSCAACGRLFSSQTALERHQLRNHSTSPATAFAQEAQCEHCGRCLALMASDERKEQHRSVCGPAAALQAGSTDTAVCCKCNESFRQLVMYRQHMFKHIHPFTCAHCRRAFRTLEERGKHVCLSHCEKCCECGQEFVTVIQLERHALSHGVPCHHCFECGRSFHKTDDFTVHRCFELDMKINRRTEKLIGVTDDSSPAPFLSAVAKKNRRAHRATREETHVCEVCGETYKNANSFKYHRLLHAERRYECSVCKKRFHRKDVLAEHLYVHQDAQVRCDVCNKFLKSKKSLDVHMRQHTGRKLFQCQQCGKEFYQKVNLQKHMERHRPRSAPSACVHCGQRFQLAESLAKHVLEHTEGPRFSCSQCSRSFVKECMLRRHMELHAAGGYSCPACGHTLKYRNSLRRHILKLHPELARSKKSSDEVADNAVLSPEVLLTVSQLQLTTDGVQQLSLAEDPAAGGECLLDQESLNAPEDMVLYVLQEPLTCLPIQESPD